MAEEQVEQKEEKFTFLYMKQVPSQTAKDFVELANREFSGHFGFCLKALLDQLIIQQTAYSEARLDEIEQRVATLELQTRQKEDIERPKKTRVGEK